MFEKDCSFRLRESKEMVEKGVLAPSVLNNLDGELAASLDVDYNEAPENDDV